MQQSNSKHDPSGEENKYLVIRSVETLFALPLLDTREVSKVQKVTFLPDVPSIVTGVTNIRGKMVILIELAELIGLDRKRRNEVGERYMVIIEDENYTVGLVVDEIERVQSIYGTDIQKHGSSKKFTVGAVESKDTFVFVLDSQLLSKNGYGIGSGINLEAVINADSKKEVAA